MAEERKGPEAGSLETGMGRSRCNSARRKRRNRRARNGPCPRTRIHTVATGVIDNSPAPSGFVNAEPLGEELKFYPRRPRLKSVRPDQARHFATHTEGLFRIKLGLAVMSAARPLFHRKRKSICDLAMSQKCQERTHALSVK